MKKSKILDIIGNIFIVLGVLCFLFCIIPGLITGNFRFLLLGVINLVLYGGLGLYFRKTNIIKPERLETKTEIITDTDDKVYLIVTREYPLRPYMDKNGRAYLITGNRKAEDFVEKGELENMKAVEFGILDTIFESILNNNGFTGIYKDGILETRLEYLGSALERAVYRCLQRNNYPNRLYKDMLEDDELSLIKEEINKLPLLVAFVYDNEDTKIPVYDGMLHMTKKAHDQYLKIEDKGTYYSIRELCPDKEMVILRKDDMIVYFGDRETSPIGKKPFIPVTPNTMHPRVADNPRERISALAAYSSMETLKSFFKNTRVALFSFEELSDHIRETNGMMLDLGGNGLCAFFDIELVIELANIKLNTYNNSLN